MRTVLWLLGPVIVAAAAVLLLHNGEVPRADRLVLEMLGISVLLWVLLGAGNGIRCAVRDRQRK